jgi:hypothetical protein
MRELQTPDLQAQPCYKPTLKSLFDLLSKPLHLFCKDRNGILECGIFGLIVCDRCREGNGGGGRSGQRGRDGIGSCSALRSWFFLKAGQADLGEVASAATVVTDQRARVLLQAVLMRLRAAATTAILPPFAPLLDDVLVE